MQSPMPTRTTKTPRRLGRDKGEHAAYQSWSHPSADNPLLDAEVIEKERDRLPEETFLQEYGGRFVGEGIPLCDVCHYPRPRKELRTVFIFNGEKAKDCPACGNPVDPRDGRAILAAGQTTFKTIILDRRREDAPAWLGGGGE